MAVHFPLDEIRRKVGEWKFNLLQRKATLFRLLAVELQEQARSSFRTLSHGARGQDRGITWSPLKPSYVEWKQYEGYSTDIGIRTGKMFAELNRFITSDGFYVVFPTEYAKHFDKRRELLPETLPPLWERGLNESTIQWADQHLKFPGENQS